MKKKSLTSIAAIHASVETLAEPGIVNVNQGIIMPTGPFIRQLVYPGILYVEINLSSRHV